MKTLHKADSERFQSGADQYAAYLETPEGRLRSDLTFANLQDFLPVQAKPSLCALISGAGRSDCRSPGATWHSRHTAGFLTSDAGYCESRGTGSRGYGQGRTATRRRYSNWRTCSPLDCSM